jgi:probable O-glycosylation ligase (exosortase A-associated)
MRDLLVVAIVVIGAVIALRRPWVGVMLWTWLSIMNPHRYTWGFAYDAPVAALAAASTLVGLLLTRERESPFKGPGPVILLLFMMWMTISWLMGLDPAGDYPQWDKVMKIDFMILVALALLRTKTHIFALAWVCTLSLALLGAKGGLFTILTAGSYRVWGPPMSFIADNNHFALATVMTIPLLRFLQLQLTKKWARHGMTLMMILLAASALGSHSRGGFLALGAMAAVLWWRSPGKVLGAFVMVVAGLSLIAFMPEHWTERMATIETYKDDLSVLGRFSAWWVSWRVAFDYPFGVGFHLSRPELFAQYSPYPELGTPVAHSIYFQVLGHHGFVGLFLFLLIWVSTWFTAARIRREAARIPQARWCVDLAGMCQVSLAGYLVGGAFLNLSYFDLPYNLMVLVVLTHQWVRRRAWETESVGARSRWSIPGLHAAPAAR